MENKNKKQRQYKPQVKRRKETKARVEISKMEIWKTVKNINEPKAGSLK